MAAPSRYFPLSGVLLDELLLLERPEQAVDGCLRDPQPIRDLGNAESR